jgi:drug/metabolite transporter (DMT)-like permease
VGALAALAAALALAVNAVMVRKLPSGQSTVHKLMLNYLLILPASFVLMLSERAAWDPKILFSALGSALFILGYNITVLLAYRQVDANQVTSAEYTGLIWAVLIGWIGVNETPDLWFAVGSAVIVIPLFPVGLRSRQLSHRVRQADPTNC